MDVLPHLFNLRHLTFVFGLALLQLGLQSLVPFIANEALGLHGFDRAGPCLRGPPRRLKFIELVVN